MKIWKSFYLKNWSFNLKGKKILLPRSVNGGKVLPERLKEMGARVCDVATYEVRNPKVDKNKHKLILYEIKDVVELSPGYMGIPEPSSGDDRLVNLGEVDLVIIPGAAFDYSGNRLGYGAGYYDILLSEGKRKIPIIALAYEEQLVDSIPSETHDVKVDIIVTDKRVINT